MLDLDRDRGLRRLFNVARRRVITGFAVAVVAFALATPTWTTLAAGAAIALAGEALRLWAAGHLLKGREVTMSGPYRWMQHPLYVGSGLLGVGVFRHRRQLGGCRRRAGLRRRDDGGGRSAWRRRLCGDAFGDTYLRYVAGDVTPAAAGRRFSLRRAIDNREHHAVGGLLGTVAVMAVKAWFAAP